METTYSLPKDSPERETVVKEMLDEVGGILDYVSRMGVESIRVVIEARVPKGFVESHQKESNK